jgi:uncharacterized membrane protein YcaP (DUF421 family)
LDWKALFVPDQAIFETILRGSITYLVLFFFLRTLLKREASTVSISDLLVIVLIADAAQNAMAGSYTSITNGLILVFTIIFWSMALDWVGQKFPAFGSWTHPPPLLLVQDGQMNYRNMRKELISTDELMSQVRQAGLEDIAQVRKAFLEGNGQISVIRKDGQEVNSKKGSNQAH